MINKLLLFAGVAILLFISTNAFSQTDYQDVVYLKNGSIIRGMIIEQVPNQSLKIETADRNVFVFQMDEIEKITKEPKVIDRSKTSEEGAGSFYDKGYQGVIDAGYAFGVGDFGLDFIKLNIIHGYRANDNFALGIGTGIRYYSDLESIFVPVFADFRANFNTSNVSPYLVVNLGYSFNASNDFEGVGLLFSPSIGIMFNTSAKTAVNFSVSYEMQKMKVQYFLFNPYNFGFSSVYETNQTIGSISLNLGLTF